MTSTNSDTVILARYITRHEGEIAQGFLLDADIPAALFTDDAGGMEPQLAFIRPARLVVRREHVEEATEVLQGAGLTVEVASE
jgi:hypothetical protein